MHLVCKFLSTAGELNEIKLFLTIWNYMHIIWCSKQFHEKSVNDKVQWFQLIIYEHIYSPIRQAQTEKYRYIQKDTILGITKHIVVELTQQVTNSFMQWNKNSPRAVITIKNHKWSENIMQWARFKDANVYKILQYAVKANI